MSETLKILMLEDSATDAEIIQRLLKKEKTPMEFCVVLNKETYERALEEFKPDLILADNSLPQFNATEALKIVHKNSSDIPFILVTGTVSDEFAAAIIKQGADDYILKDRLTRLPAAIEGALKQRHAEREKRDAWQKLIQMNGRLRELSGHLQTIKEEERKHMAREIHDQLGQQLTAIKMDITWLNKKLKWGDKEISDKIQSVDHMLDETVKMVRRIASELRPSLLDHMGLGAAVEWHLKEFEKRSGIYAVFAGSVSESDLVDSMKINLFRIVQESLTNVARHSLAKNVLVSLKQEGPEITLIIQDDGIGFNVLEITSKGTLGMLGMKERTAMIGGTYEVSSIPRYGTTVTVRVRSKVSMLN